MSRSAFAAFVAGVLGVVAALGTSVLIGRSLGPSGKGAYDLMSATALLLSVALGLSLAGGISYAVARRLADPGALLRTSYLFALAQFGVALLVLAAIREFVPNLIPPGVGDQALVATAVLVGLASLATYLRGLLVGRELIVRASVLDLAARVALAVAVVVVVFVFGTAPLSLDYVVVLWAAVVAGVLSCIAFRVGVQPIVAGVSGPRGLRTVIGFALPSYLGNLVQFLNYRLDLFLVSTFAGLGAVGIYALAVSLSQMVWLVTNPIALMLLPRIAAEAGTSGGTDVGRVSRVSLLLSMGVAGALAVVGPTFIGVAYGDQFRGASVQLLALLPGVALFGLVNVLAAYIGGRGRPRLNLYVALGGLIATLSLDVALIPTLGGLGAAIASSVSYGFSALLTVALAVRLSGLGAREFVVPRRADLTLARATIGRLIRVLNEARRPHLPPA